MKIPDLDLGLVRCFLTVVESGSFTLAARRLNLSQSAVSLKIQRLESVLGRGMFIRTSRSLALTPEGNVVLGYARRLLELSQEMIRLVAQPAVKEVLRLGVVQQFSLRFLPEVLARFKRRHPEVSLTVEVGMTANLLRDLEEDRFDLVLGAVGHPRSRGAKANAFTEDRILMKETLHWVRSASSRLDFKNDPVPLILFTAPCGFRQTALDLLEKAGRSWQIVYSGTSPASIQAAVQADLGISVLAESSLLPGIKIIPAMAGLPALPETAVAVYRGKSHSGPLMDSLVTLIEKAVRCRLRSPQPESARQGSARRPAR